MLRLGLAGLGVHGRRYAHHLLAGDVPGAVLSVICRRDEQAGRELAGSHGLEFVREPEALAAHPGVDAVVLVLPPDRHPAAAEACLSAGRPVLVEKPLAPDAASAARLAECVERSGTPLMVGQTLRFDAVVEALYRERESVGELSLVTLNQRFEPSDRGWIDTPGAGGLFLNTGVHGFDLLRYLTEREPVSIWAESSRVCTSRTEDQFVATVRFDGDVQAVVDNARSTRSRSGRIELVGRTGQLWGDHIHRTLVRVEDRETTDLGPIPPSPTVPATLSAFVHCLQNDEPPPVTVQDGRAAVRMVEAATRSAAENQPIRMEKIP